MNLPVIFLFLLLSTTAWAKAQANIAISCPVTQKILQDGSVQVVDCNGQPVGKPKPPEAPAASPPATPPSDVKLPASSPAGLAYQSYLEAYYKYQSHSLSYAESVFDWQYKSSKVIFFVVILLVLSGLAFAAIQFAIAMRVPLRSQKPTTIKTAGDPSEMGTTTFEASPHGVKITSSVVGLLILVVSIGFFYLYLVYVYPIQNIAQ